MPLTSSAGSCTDETNLISSLLTWDFNKVGGTGVEEEREEGEDGEERSKGGMEGGGRGGEDGGLRR